MESSYVLTSHFVSSRTCLLEKPTLRPPEVRDKKQAKIQKVFLANPLAIFIAVGAAYSGEAERDSGRKPNGIPVRR
jgi:hypothetical protein